MTTGGTTLAGRYELDREIGRGGMGAVWLGHDTVLGRTVAIKQIGMAAGGASPDLARAEREAHLAARVNHQNVVAVYDLVDDGGHQWLVMEHVDGPTLAGLIAQHGPLSPEALTSVVEQVAGALAAAHEHGIVHRDVKPSNILLTEHGVAKLSDFGVARAQADASLTQTGLVTGSPAYLAPEVATGRTATAASDVWSLGATVFHALAGHPPYDVGDNLLGAMYRIVHEDPPRLPDDGPLTAIVSAMMQQDPDARPTMAEIERSVAGHAAELPAEPAPDLETTQAFTAFGEQSPPQSTVALHPVESPVAALPPVPPPAVPAPAGSRRAEHREHGSRGLWLGVAAAAVVLVAVAAVFGLMSGGGGGDGPGSDVRASAGTAEPSSPDDDEAPADAGGSTADAIEGFAADYLTAASNDPDEGFAMLTPAYQDESGGLAGYKGFWDGVSNLDVQDVRAEPDALTVSYTYAYDYDGDRRTEAVTLQLEESGDGFLIAGAS
jgi:hypothetical protein